MQTSNSGVGSLPTPFWRFPRVATRSTAKKRRPTRPHLIHKPRGVLHPRVQAVGPEHFGIVSIDCAKARSKWILADFYGRVFVPPALLEHNQTGFQAALQALRA